MKPPDPYISYITGWLHGSAMKYLSALNLTDCPNETPQSFLIHLASGLVLRVKVEVAASPAEKPT